MNKILKYLTYFLIFGIIVVIILLFVTNHYSLTLIGDEEIEVYINDDYLEPGYRAYNYKNEDVSNLVTVINNVNTNKLGTYTVEYTIGSQKKYRTVNVIVNPSQQIKMWFEDGYEINLWKNSQYTLPKVYAYDEIDGNISDKIIQIGSVDITTIGTYDVKYSVTNSRKGSNYLTLKVNVSDIKISYDAKYENGEYKGIFTINDNNYSKVILPNDSEISKKEFTYTYENNQKYVFKIYDKYNNLYNYEIKVEKVDNESPKLSCTTTLYDNFSKVVVSATDDIGIDNYIYKYGDNTKKLTTNEFTYTEMINQASVTVTDYSGKTSTVDCTTVDSSTKYGRQFQQYSSSYNYWLYIPPTLSKRNTLPVVVFLHGRGECGGTYLNNGARHGFPKYISEGRDYDFVLIAPHLTSNQCSGFSVTKTIAILNEVIKKYNLDSNRIFASGFSLGCRGVYNMVQRNPSMFAGAIVAGCNGTRNGNLLSTPIWSFCGTADSNCSNEENVMEWIIKRNSQSKFFPLKGISHEGTPQYAFNNNSDMLNFIATTYRD